MVLGRHLVLLAFASLVGGAVLSASASPVSASAPSLPSGCVQVVGTGTVTCTFDYTGDAQTFTVPPGVSHVGLLAIGGHGGTVHQISVTTPGGRGADVSGTFAVQAGDVLTVTVGGDATSWAGAFGYGHGGSSSDTSLGAGGGGGTAVADGGTLLLVAGAGGGGGVLDGRCPGPGVGGDAGADGGSSVPCGHSQVAFGGLAGSAPTEDGGDSVPAVSAGGGGGGGGDRGGDGGEDSPLLAPNLCCLSAGGGGGGTNYADPSGIALQTGLSDRTSGTNGLVQISYEPQGPTTQLGLSPDPGSVNVGTQQSYAVTGYNAEGAAVADLSGQATLSISPDGSCSATSCTAAATGPHTVTAVYSSLTTTATMDATRAPAFTSPSSVTFTRLRSGAATVRATGVPEPRIAHHGGAHLPAGLTLTSTAAGTATIAGTPTGRPTTRRVTLTATSAAGRATQVLTVVVAPLPGACTNRFVGTTGHDRLLGTPAGDRLVGLAGNDTLPGYAGADCLSGGAGRDDLFGDQGNDRVSGGSGNDVLVGGPGRDVLRGGAGNDVIRAADAQRDVVVCGPGRDTVVADRRDVLRGCERVTIR